jgi:hypothetical protein
MYDEELEFALQEQADEIYREQLMASYMAGGSDPYGDAEYARACFRRSYDIFGDDYDEYDEWS